MNVYTQMKRVIDTFNAMAFRKLHLRAPDSLHSCYTTKR
jgi:hypothetical protein